MELAHRPAGSLRWGPSPWTRSLALVAPAPAASVPEGALWGSGPHSLHAHAPGFKHQAAVNCEAAPQPASSLTGPQGTGHPKEGPAETVPVPAAAAQPRATLPALHLPRPSSAEAGAEDQVGVREGHPPLPSRPHGDCPPRRSGSGLTSGTAASRRCLGAPQALPSWACAHPMPLGLVSL